MERVVITGIGLVTPDGIGTRGDVASPPRRRARHRADHALRRDGVSRPLRRRGEELRPRSSCMPKKKLKEMDRFAQLAVAASDALLEGRAARADRRGPREVRHASSASASAGSSTSSSTRSRCHEKGPAKVSPYFDPRRHREPRRRAGRDGARPHGAELLQHQRVLLERAHAIGEASEWIRRGRTPIMVAGGAEATITGLGIGGFEAMFALSRRNDEPTRASRPLDKGRDGFVCGEGAGIAGARVAHPREEARRQDLRRDHRLRRVERRLPPHEARARRRGRAARDAHGARGRERRRPTQIDYVNAHGTSTPHRRRRGVARDRRRCSASTPLVKKLWVSSTKSMMGHLLGAAGARRGGGLRARDPRQPRPADHQPRRSGSRSARSTTCRNTARERRAHARDDQLVRLRRHERDARDPLALRGLMRSSLDEVPVLRPPRDKVIDSRAGGAGDVIRRRRECEALRAALHDLRARRGHAADRGEEGRPARAVRSREGAARPPRRLQQAAGLDRAASRASSTRSSASSRTPTSARSRSAELGERVMRELRELDEVAYVRFASVYRSVPRHRRVLDELGKLVKSSGPTDR